MKILYIVATTLLGFGGLATPLFAQEDVITIFMFGRDDCRHCVDEKEFLTAYTKNAPSVRFEYLNVMKDERAKVLLDQVLTKHNLSRITPVTVIGLAVFQGFDTEESTGTLFRNAVEVARLSDIRTLEDHIDRAPSQSDVESVAGCNEDGTECGTSQSAGSFIFKLPFLGVIDLQTFSLFSLSVVLGTIDGFNPCAMWVLLTFLILLSQVGSKKKMLYVAGTFILAETVMYNLILNAWFSTWDFIGLDSIVTPLVGILALGGGVFFLHRYRKNRNAALACDVSDLETQDKTVVRIQKLIARPISIMTFLGIVGIAFSVNIIEFACSIGIPQAYTKILELNSLDFLMRQGYILVYTLGYMLDDVVVFGLALWGFSKLESHGHKYSQLSLLIGGVLMLILGMLLIVNPSFLVL